MNLAILQYPNPSQIALCRELGDATGPLNNGEVLMSLADYQVWLQEPAQLTAIQMIKDSRQFSILYDSLLAEADDVLTSLDEKSARSLRSILVAQAANTTPNATDVSKLASYEAQAATVRTAITSINAATTLDQLNIIIL